MDDPRTTARNAARPHAVYFRGPRQTLESLTNRRTPQSSDQNESERLRILASAVHEHTRRYLPETLETLKKNLIANGIQVHWAETVEQGNAIVARLIGEGRIKQLVKSHSAVCTKTGLEQAAESHGVAVTESDLASNLAPMARRTLRDKFATAEAGLSGVSFAVAETGTLILAENEGNARMCSTLPRLHIAVMGLEKMIPQLDDIPPLLSLLTRSASGQAITVYVSMISSPRQPGEKDGPDAIHLIILDNAPFRRHAESRWRKALQRIRYGDRLSGGPDSINRPDNYSLLGARGWSAEDRLSLLRQKMNAAGGEFLDARGGDWLAALQQWLAKNAIPGCIYAPTTRLGRKIAAGWDGRAPLMPFQRPLADWKDELFAQGGAGITTTRGGIAETGSLILWPDALEPRSLSLIPPVHVALLDIHQLYDTLWQAMREQNWQSRMPGNLLLLSGPSCTMSPGSDPVIGIHGPKRLLVILVDGDPAA